MLRDNKEGYFQANRLKGIDCWRQLQSFCSSLFIVTSGCSTFISFLLFPLYKKWWCIFIQGILLFYSFLDIKFIYHKVHPFKVYSFLIYSQSCIHRVVQPLSKLILEYFHHSQKTLYLLFPVLPIFSSPGWSLLICLFRTFHINWIMRYALCASGFFRLA